MSIVNTIGILPRARGLPRMVFLLKNKTRKAIAAAVTEDDRSGVSTYPDIIAHRRMPNEENLLVVEVIKGKRCRVGHEHDRSKLEAFTENTDQNSYHFTVWRLHSISHWSQTAQETNADMVR